MSTNQKEIIKFALRHKKTKKMASLVALDALEPDSETWRYDYQLQYDCDGYNVLDKVWKCATYEVAEYVANSDGDITKDCPENPYPGEWEVVEFPM